MRSVLLLSTLLLAACGAGPQGASGFETDDTAAANPAPPRLDYPAKMRIPVRLDLLATADGGRVAGIPAAWRGEVEFDGGARMRCALVRNEAGELSPGSSHEVKLLCAKSVQLPGDGQRGFRILEEDRVVGSGVVLP